MPIPQPDKQPYEDGILVGCKLGCLSQTAFLLVGLVIAIFLNNRQGSDLAYLSAGLTQWILIIPLVISHRRKHHPQIVQGLIITGAIGLLLSSACASLSLR